MAFPQTILTWLWAVLLIFPWNDSFGLDTATLELNPVYIKVVTHPYEQFNDVHPRWSNDGKIISFERYDHAQHTIILSDRNGKKLQTISIGKPAELAMENLFQENATNISFNSGLSWAPDNQRFVFTSNGQGNNFDLYIGKFGLNKNRRLTYHHQKDSHASWSPDGRHIVFVSSRSGLAQLYLIDTKTYELTRLLNVRHNAFYPVWSPDSRRIAFIQESDARYQVFVMDNIGNPETSLRQVTDLPGNSLRPSWSWDGEKLAFYYLQDSLHALSGWKILIASYSSPTPVTVAGVPSHTVAEQVILNSESGPTWLPDNQGIAFVKDLGDQNNPIYLVNIHSKQQWRLNTNTRLNRDLACAEDGVLAFQTQDRQWNRIFITKLPEIKG